MGCGGDMEPCCGANMQRGAVLCCAAGCSVAVLDSGCLPVAVHDGVAGELSGLDAQAHGGTHAHHWHHQHVVVIAHLHTRTADGRWLAGVVFEERVGAWVAPLLIIG